MLKKWKLPSRFQSVVINEDDEHFLNLLTLSYAKTSSVTGFLLQPRPSFLL